MLKFLNVLYFRKTIFSNIFLVTFLVTQFDYFKVTFNTVKDTVHISSEEDSKRGQTGDRQGTEKSKGNIILTEKQQQVLDLIIKNRSISRREIADAMEIKEGIVIKHLEALKRKDVIERIGGDFGGQWKILIEPDKINFK